ncbi:MAG: ABC-F family ATP-binding cassette domain-containing protein [Heliobacteriaceae bacterium]|nr:ABC-F family ATP-binding cassette domain-containing protein [Heliobacteriaceae bacterium]
MRNTVILQVRDLGFTYGSRPVFSGVSFMIHAGEKVGLAGPNGAGKTSLFNVLTGAGRPEAGTVTWRPNVRINYVSQVLAPSPGRTVFALAMESLADILALRAEIARLEGKMAHIADGQDRQQDTEVLQAYADVVQRYEADEGYSAEARVRSVLKGLGFSEADFERPAQDLSGGQKTRLGLACLLLRPADLLLLDEPTNHLDLTALEWLETYLRDYRGAVLVISHDRYFLDRICSYTLYLENGQLTGYPGNYTQCLAQRAAEQTAYRQAFAREQAAFAREEAYIRRNRAGVNAKQARGRATRLARRERLAPPETGLRLADLKFIPQMPSAEQVLIIHDLAASYPGRPLFTGLNLVVRRGECIAVVGKNGTGKTSLFRLLTGELAPAAGEIRFGLRVKPAYFAQELEHLNPEVTVLEAVREWRPLSEEQARTLLGRFLFRGDDVFKKAGVLSGGEKTRLVLAQLFLSGANLLLLDEPTNNLDIEAKDTLEKALAEFPGTLLVISHDRFFLDRLADRVLELDRGRFTEYNGNYSDYRADKKARATLPVPTPTAAMPKPDLDGKPNRDAGTKPANPWKKARALADIEGRIMVLEEKLAGLTAALAREETYKDGEQARKITAEYESTRQVLRQAYTAWEELAE